MGMEKMKIINNTDMQIMSDENGVCVYNPLFKQDHKKTLFPIIGWCASMDIFNGIPKDHKQYNLIKYLKDIRINYVNTFSCRQIDFIIHYNDDLKGCEE